MDKRYEAGFSTARQMAQMALGAILIDASASGKISRADAREIFIQVFDVYTADCVLGPAQEGDPDYLPPEFLIPPPRVTLE